MYNGEVLLSVRMCVKSLVDKAAFEAVGDDCIHLDNFCAVLEHIFTHRIQGKGLQLTVIAIAIYLIVIVYTFLLCVCVCVRLSVYV